MTASHWGRLDRPRPRGKRARSRANGFRVYCKHQPVRNAIRRAVSDQMSRTLRHFKRSLAWKLYS
jgi:hypothetical protein